MNCVKECTFKKDSLWAVFFPRLQSPLDFTDEGCPACGDGKVALLRA